MTRLVSRAVSTAISAVSLSLVGCAAHMHPQFQNVYYRYDVEPRKLDEIRQQMAQEGLSGAEVKLDSLGRVQLAGSFRTEADVERALQLSRRIVGAQAVSDVRPADVGIKEWEESASRELAKFIAELATKFGLSSMVKVVQIETEPQGNAVRDSRPLVKRTGATLAAFFDEGPGGRQFEPDAEEPNEHAKAFYAELGRRYAASKQLPMILLVGHADDIGNSAYNATLSEKRARAVGQILSLHGFPTSRIYYQGAGETLPIADNRTEAGRAKNRRVEIVDLSDEQTFTAFLASRKPNLSYYRPANEVIAADGGQGPHDKGADSKSSHTKSSLETTAKARAARPAAAQHPTVASAPVSSPASMPSPSPAAADKSVAGASVTRTSTAKVASANLAELNSAANAAARATPTPVTAADIDFGGLPMSAQSRVPDIGKPTPHASSFSLIPIANASDEPPPVGNCTQDRPRVKHGVKSLKNDQVVRFATKDYLPGVYGTSWADTVNGHLVAVTNVAVLRDGGQPATRPDVMIYKNYVAGTNPTPDFSTAADANAYQGSKAMLYRVFFGSGPLRCIDLVIPYNAANTAPGSTLAYLRDHALFQADFSPRIAR